MYDKQLIPPLASQARYWLQYNVVKSCNINTSPDSQSDHIWTIYDYSASQESIGNLKKLTEQPGFEDWVWPIVVGSFTLEPLDRCFA